MDQAASCRRAARDAVSDVEPTHLHDVISDQIDGASMVPGVLTLESAATIDPGVDLPGIAHHAAGVQLIYEGLRLTRTLAHEEPWLDADVNGDADLEILAADILVSRGFYLLARTDAAGKAVRTVQAFGRDQTLRDQPGADAERLDANLERDVLELAVLTGAAAVDATPTPELVALANEIGDASGTDFPPAEECLKTVDSLEADASPGDGVAADRPTDRATSATDP